MRRKFRTFCLSLFLMLLFSNLIYAATDHKIDKDVNQQQMLNIIRSYIQADNIPIGGQYFCRVHCAPMAFLPAGNCFIEWIELREQPYDKETAYKEAIKKYSLNAYNGTYDIHYLQNQVNIVLNKILSGNFIATMFEYKDGKNTQVGIDNSNDDYWINAAIEAKELERIASVSVIRYYPIDGDKVGALPPK